MRSKVVINNIFIEQISTFNYLGCSIHTSMKKYYCYFINISSANRNNYQNFKILSSPKTRWTDNLQQFGFTYFFMLVQILGN